MAFTNDEIDEILTRWSPNWKNLFDDITDEQWAALSKAEKRADLVDYYGGEDGIKSTLAEEEELAKEEELEALIKTYSHTNGDFQASCPTIYYAAIFSERIGLSV